MTTHKNIIIIFTSIIGILILCKLSTQKTEKFVPATRQLTDSITQDTNKFISSVMEQVQGNRSKTGGPVSPIGAPVPDPHVPYSPISPETTLHHHVHNENESEDSHKNHPHPPTYPHNASPHPPSPPPPPPSTNYKCIMQDPLGSNEDMNAYCATCKNGTPYGTPNKCNKKCPSPATSKTYLKFERNMQVSDRPSNYKQNCNQCDPNCCMGWTYQYDENNPKSRNYIPNKACKKTPTPPKGHNPKKIPSAIPGKAGSKVKGCN